MNIVKVPFSNSHYNYSMRRLLSCVNKCDAASQSDQEAIEAGKECSDKLELCSVSVASTTKPTDVTAAAESDNNNDIPKEINAKVALVESPGDLLICGSLFYQPVVFFYISLLYLSLKYQFYVIVHYT